MYETISMIVFYPRFQLKGIIKNRCIKHIFFMTWMYFFSYGFLITIGYCLNINRRSGSYSVTGRV